MKAYAEQNNNIYGLNISINTSIAEIKNLIIAKLNFPKCIVASKIFNPIN